MARNVGWTMTFTFRGVDQLSPAAQSAERSTRRLGSTIQQTSSQGRAGLAALAGAYNAMIVAQRAARWMAAAVQPAMEMEQAANRLKVTTGLTAQQVGFLEEAARKAAAVTPFAPPEAVEVATQLNLVLRDVNQTAAALIPVTSLAATHMDKDFTAAAKMATRIAGGFDLRVEGLATKLDQLVAVARVTGIQVNSMQGGFKRLGLAAFRMNTDFKDVVKVFALAAREGLPASMAATGLLTGVGRLSKGSIQAGLKANLGVIVESNGAFRSMTDILIDLNKAREKLGETGAAKFQAGMRAAFGDRAVKPWLAALDQMRKGVMTTSGEVLHGAEIFKAQDAALATSSGLLKQQTVEAMMPLSAQIELLRESIGILLEKAFRPMLSVLTPIASGLKRAALATKEFLVAHPAIQSAITGIAKFGGMLLSVLTGIFAVSAAASMMRAAFMFLGQSAGAGGLSGRLAGVVVNLVQTQKAIWANYRAAQALQQQNITSMRTSGMWSVTAANATKALRTMKNAMYSTALSVKALAMSFAPLILMQGAISWLKIFGVDLFGPGAGGTDIDKLMKDAEKLGKTAIKRQNMEDRTIGKLGTNVDMLNDAIKGWTKLQKLKFPIPSFAGLKQFSKLIPLIGQVPGMGPKGVQQMQNWLATVRKSQKQIADPKLKINQDDLLKAQGALKEMLNTVKMFDPSNKRLIDSFKALGADFGRGAQGSAEFKNTLVKMHFKENQLVDVQQKAIDGTTAEIAARRELLKTQRENLKMFILQKGGPEAKKLREVLKRVPGGMAGVPTERLIEGAQRTGARKSQIEAAQAEVERWRQAVEDMTGKFGTQKGGEIDPGVAKSFGQWLAGWAQPEALRLRKEGLAAAQANLKRELGLVTNTAREVGATMQTQAELASLNKTLKGQKGVLHEITAPVTPVAGAVRPGMTTPPSGGSPAASLDKIAAATDATAKALAKKQKINFSGNLRIGDEQLPLIAEQVARAERKKGHEGL